MLELSKIKKNCTWQQAMDYATKLGEGWRLPSKKELMIIYGSPKAKKYATKGWFWSSSSLVDCSNFAWDVDFGDGYVSNFDKAHTYAVRCLQGSFEDLVTWCFNKEKLNGKK
jgi:hypothetical protein